MAARGRLGPGGGRGPDDAVVTGRILPFARRSRVERPQLEGLFSIDDLHHFVFDNDFGGLVVPYISPVTT